MRNEAGLAYDVISGQMGLQVVKSGKFQWSQKGVTIPVSQSVPTEEWDRPI